MLTLKGLCHRFRITVKYYNSQALGMEIWRQVLQIFLIVSLKCEGPSMFYA
jgi:hypothetical protein